VIDCTANYRSAFSSERAPHTKKEELVGLKKILNLVMGPKGGGEPTPRINDRLTACREINFKFNFQKLVSTYQAESQKVSY
jgi:hypothetical protein